MTLHQTARFSFDFNCDISYDLTPSTTSLTMTSRIHLWPQRLHKRLQLLPDAFTCDFTWLPNSLTPWLGDFVTPWHTDFLTSWLPDSLTPWHLDTLTSWHPDTLTSYVTSLLFKLHSVHLFALNAASNIASRHLPITSIHASASLSRHSRVPNTSLRFASPRHSLHLQLAFIEVHL